MATTLPEGWSEDGRTLRRTYTFADFPQAMSFMVEVAFHCEARDHHPAWSNLHSRVDVVLTTFDAGRVTDKDLRLAEIMNDVYAACRA